MKLTHEQAMSLSPGDLIKVNGIDRSPHAGFAKFVQYHPRRRVVVATPLRHSHPEDFDLSRCHLWVAGLARNAHIKEGNA